MKQLMKGNHALAEAAIRAGCRFFAGYPITPQSEILEYFSWRMPEAGGSFAQTSSEIEGINQVLGAAAAGQRAITSSSGPGFTLKQEGISYMQSLEVPAVIVDVMRYGIGLGDIFYGQGDYFQATKGGGHGGYLLPVYAPSSVQENADLVALAFDTAEKYRSPVIVLSDAAIGQMCGSVELPEMKEFDIDRFEWALKGRDRHYPQGRTLTDRMYYDFGYDEYDKHERDRYDAMKENEQLWEEVQAEDAEVILVSYGISSRICKEAVKAARAEGLRLGLIRAITVWPFPTKAFQKYNGKASAYMTVEMSQMGQMAEDAFIAAHCQTPVYSMPTGRDVADSEDIIANVKDILAGRKEAF
ncbi:MAG: 3-methyl-2-oxobutanoate dehydrogenase subunit VorB [Clostridiales Family XIII bacterium]|jgi:2-oxoglutarate ferredoxin oxidoreductase subunit alpha|nr:3-methyl-2-oxobutanoate dehydrogenase subunit VorB [Clostridiales Family XIII bacterium]